VKDREPSLLLAQARGDGAAFGPPFCFLSEGPITELSSVAVEMGSFYQHQERARQPQWRPSRRSPL
jgi:hypothetical protein